jgi:ribosomal protein S17
METIRNSRKEIIGTVTSAKMDKTSKEHLLLQEKAMITIQPKAVRVVNFIL